MVKMSYFKAHYKTIIKDIVFMYVLMVVSNVIATYGTNGHDMAAYIESGLVKLFLLSAILSIPAGIGLYFLQKKWLKNGESYLPTKSQD